MREPVDWHVSPVSDEMTEDELAEGLSDLGKISRVYFAKDWEERRRGFAIVRILTNGDPEAAMEAAYGRKFHGRRIHIAIAHPRRVDADSRARRTA